MRWRTVPSNEWVSAPSSVTWLSQIVSTSFDELNFIGEHDGSTLSRKHKRSQKQFLDIYGALSDPSAELNKKVLHKVAVLVLKIMTTVTHNEFEIASKDPSGAQLISTAAITKIYNWREANRSPLPGEDYHRPCWNDGSPMIQKQINELQAVKYPDIF